MLHSDGFSNFPSCSNQAALNFSASRPRRGHPSGLITRWLDCLVLFCLRSRKVLLLGCVCGPNTLYSRTYVRDWFMFFRRHLACKGEPIRWHIACGGDHSVLCNLFVAPCLQGGPRRTESVALGDWFNFTFVAPCLQGGPHSVAHRLRWGPQCTV